ncbi:MAG: hypothetical protein KAR11_02325 [Phycisphaerae bacterium]|nr:hypothetical protein [Phycisphaerae bacterium]
MKNAKLYERKIKKLLSGMKKTVKVELADESESIAVILESVLLGDGTDIKHVNKSISTFTNVFVDFNELRAAPEKEISDCFDKNVTEQHEKATTISVVLNAIFTISNTLDVAYIREKSNRDIRRHLRELGFPNFAEALVARRIFDIHAVPIDKSLLEVLEMNEMIHPGADIDDTQSFLERIVLQKHDMAAHEFFRGYIAQNATALEKKRKEDAKRLAVEQAEREAKAEAKRLADEEKQRKADERQAAREAKEQEKAEKAAAKKKEAAKKKKAAERAKAKAAKKKTVKKVAKKTTKKTVKKAAKKTTKKAVKKVAKKTAKKTKSKKK